MEKRKKGCESDSSVIYHIKVLYGAGLFLFIVLIAEIWIYYKRLYSLQLQINSIALAQTLLNDDRTIFFNSSRFQHDFHLTDLELLSRDLTHFRIKRKIGSRRNTYHSPNQVSRN